MKLGQALKNALDELSKQDWKKIETWGEARPALEITVDPQYSRAVEILMKEGLKRLKQRSDKYSNIGLFLKNDIYIQLVSYAKDNQKNPLPNEFMKELAVAINDYIKELSSDWMKSKTPIDEIIIPEEYVKNYGDEMVIVEHPSMGESDVLLRILAMQYHYYPEVLDITDWTKTKNTPRNDFIIGKKDFVEEFIKTIASDLSPSHFVADFKEEAPPELKSQDISTKTSSLFSLFLSTSIDLDSMEDDKPAESKSQDIAVNITSRFSLFASLKDESPIEHVRAWEDMDKYKGKIIIFKTNYHYYIEDGKKGYLIDPERPYLKVGMVERTPTDWSEGEKGYNLKMLLRPDDVGSTRALVTSKLKYSNFYVRLPTPSELDKIKEAVMNKKARFELTFDRDQPVNAIDDQRHERESNIVVKFF